MMTLVFILFPELGIGPFGVEYLTFDPIALLVTDTKSSDLTITNPCRYIADFIALALGVPAQGVRHGALSALFRHKRDISRLVALPGSKRHRMSALASGAFGHDLATALTSARALRT